MNTVCPERFQLGIPSAGIAFLVLLVVAVMQIPMPRVTRWACVAVEYARL